MIRRTRTFYIAPEMPRQPKLRDRVMVDQQRMVVVEVDGDRVTVAPVEPAVRPARLAHRVERLIR